ncbi:pilus assembly FimT family protein [Gloeothece citriformis]|uniref:pilus assembly FimT family protein n=1 Tax=Gloeothece citriformis TaxID=2546356 RepID=UPI00138A1723|nr:type II secretion system protein [Gloeothece citriformis]
MKSNLIFIKIAVKSKDKGMTLLEILVTLALVGILASLGLPNLFSANSINDLNNETKLLKSILDNSQTQAISRGRVCQLELIADNIIRDITDYKNSPLKDCLSDGEIVTLDGQTMKQIKLLEGLELTSNLNDNKIKFSFQGMIAGNLTNSANKPATIVLSKPDINSKKCLIIYPIIGTVRVGNYIGNNHHSGLILNDTNPENSCQIRL